MYTLVSWNKLLRSGGGGGIGKSGTLLRGGMYYVLSPPYLLHNLFYPDKV